MELANGCLCCSVKSDFVSALEALMQKRDKFDYVLIETTGGRSHVWGTAALHALAPSPTIDHHPHPLLPTIATDHTVALRAAADCPDATGLANPGPIAAALWTDQEVEAGVCLDATVTVVDAANIGRQLAEQRPGGGPNEAQLQIAYADLVLLNKVGGM